MNDSISDIPVTISALRSGILLTPIMAVWDRLVICIIPTQAKVPIMVAITEAEMAILNVFQIADNI
jgi:hypothetical protein